MNGSDILTTAAAYGALLLSGFSLVFAGRSVKETRRQADLAERNIDHAREAGHGATVTHFTSRFFDLITGGMKFDDPDWTYQYWSLHATEFTSLITAGYRASCTSYGWSSWSGAIASIPLPGARMSSI
jgi:hypothetical protein